jgi:hypothetical protein
MTAHAEKVQLLVLGALATIACELVYWRVRPATEMEMPCRSAAPAGESRMPRVRAIPGKHDRDLKAALDLGAIERLQHVAVAGKRNLFDYVRTRQAIELPVAASAGTVLHVDTMSPLDAPRQRRLPLVFYGYTKLRGSAPAVFVLLEDEIYVIRQGESIRGRYRLDGLSGDSITVMDKETGDRQALSIVEPL